MTRQVKDFKNYSDFNASSVPKQRLASLCVTFRDLLIAFESADTLVNRILVEKHDSVEKIKSEITAVRENRKKVTVPIVAGIYQKRNEQFIEKLPTFELSSDIFKNVTESSETFDEDTNSQVEDLQKEVNFLQGELTAVKTDFDAVKSDLVVAN